MYNLLVILLRSSLKEIYPHNISFNKLFQWVFIGQSISQTHFIPRRGFKPPNLLRQQWTTNATLLFSKIGSLVRIKLFQWVFIGQSISWTFFFVRPTHACMYLHNLSALAGYDTRSIFMRSLTGLTYVFSFSLTSCFTKAKELSLPNYLPISG